MVALVLTAAIAGGATIMLTDRAEITVPRPVITFADVVRAPAAKGLGRLATVEIAHLPVGRDRLSLSRRAIAVLARRAIPGIAMGQGDDRVVTFKLVRTEQAKAGPCLVTSVRLAAGTAIARDKVAQGPCGGMAADLRYDAARGMLVARRDLPAGRALGNLVAAAPETVARGDTMTLVSRAGPVTVERPVTALQSGRAGRRVFVRDSAGHVFAAPLAEVTR